MITVYEIYDPAKEYSTPDGKLYTPKEFEKNYPSVNIEPMAVELMGRVIVSAAPLSYLKGMNQIKADVDNQKALSLISEKQNIKNTENTPLERIAAALEFFELLNI